MVRSGSSCSITCATARKIYSLGCNPANGPQNYWNGNLPSDSLKRPCNSVGLVKESKLLRPLTQYTGRPENCTSQLETATKRQNKLATLRFAARVRGIPQHFPIHLMTRTIPHKHLGVLTVVPTVVPIVTDDRQTPGHHGLVGCSGQR